MWVTESKLEESEVESCQMDVFQDLTCILGASSGLVSVGGKLRVGIWHDYMIELFMLVNAPLRLQLRLQHPQTTPPKQLSLPTFLALVSSWTKLNTILPRELIFV